MHLNRISRSPIATKVIGSRTSGGLICHTTQKGARPCFVCLRVHCPLLPSVLGLHTQPAQPRSRPSGRRPTRGCLRWSSRGFFRAGAMSRGGRSLVRPAARPAGVRPAIRPLHATHPPQTARRFWRRRPWAEGRAGSPLCWQSAWSRSRCAGAPDVPPSVARVPLAGVV